jgi:hypothetical protein
MYRRIEYVWTAPRCGAQTRQGRACQAPAIRGKRRCRKHGGHGSGSPRGNQHALKHGRYTAQAIAERRQVRQLWRTLKAMLRQLG